MHLIKAVLWILAIMSASAIFLVNDAAATNQSGTLSISSSTGNSYTINSPNGAAGTIGFDKFFIYSAGYNSVSKITVTLGSDWVFDIDSASTTFTVASGGTGSGTVVFYKSTNQIIWYFDSAVQLTGSSASFSYANNIFAHLTNPGSQFTDNPTVLTSTQPILFACASPNEAFVCYYDSDFPTRSIFYITQTGTIVSNSYFVNYTSNIGGLFFNTSISKSGTSINTKIRAADLNNVTYWVESSYNHVSFSNISLYGTGLKLYMYDSAGDYDVVIVNSTCGSCPTPPNTTGVGSGGSPSGQIYFDFSNATLSSAYGINVSISDANFSHLDTYFIDVIDPGNQQVSGFPISFNTQQYNTSRLWSFGLLGTYNATLSYCTFLIFCADIDTASLLVNPVAYAYNVSTDQTSYFTGQTINVTAVNPSPNTVYVNLFLAAGGQVKIDDAPVTAGTTRYFNVLVTSDMIFGEWDVTMNTAIDGVGRVASDNFTIGVPAAGQAVGIRWDENYFLGRTNNLYYVTNINSSTVIVNKPIPGTNTSSTYDTFTVAGNVSAFKTYLMDVTGYWTAYITDSGNSSNISYANMTVLSSPTCNLNGPDYVCWSNASYNLGDAFRIDYKATNLPVDQAALLRLVIYDPDNTVIANKTIINNLPVTSKDVPTTGSMTGKFKSTAKPGKWHASLIISCLTTGTCTDETQLADGFTFVVAPAATSGPTPNIPTGGEAAGSMQSNLLYFMSTKAFWGVLLFAALLVTGRNNANIGYIAFVMVNVFAVIGLFDPFKWYILAVAWIGAGIFFYVGRQASSGGP